VISRVGGGFELSQPELSDEQILCPACEEPAFLDWPDGVKAVVTCACGFVCAAEKVVNLPAAWVTRAYEDDLLEEVRESALAMIEASDLDGQTVGAELLDIVDSGGQDLPGLERIRAALPSGSAAGAAIDALLGLRRRGKACASAATS